MHPGITWPENIEHFEPTDTQHINNGKFPVSGDKVFDILYLGKKEGRAVLPPVTFNYFDPKTQSYSTLRSDSIPLIFTAALPKVKVMQAADGISNKNLLWVVASIGLIAAIILFAGNKNYKTQKQAVAAAPVQHDEELKHDAHTKKPSTDFSAVLQALNESGGNRDFFITGKNIIHNAVSEKFGSTIMIDELPVLKQPKNEQLKRDILSFCKTCDYAIYAYDDSDHDFLLLNKELASIITRIQLLQV